jgi:hypothetical protein
MKKVSSTFGVLLITGLMAITTLPSMAQGRGHGHHKHMNHCDDRQSRHHHCNVREYHCCEHHHKPRYVYYRSYDVYYDQQRSVYISFTGRNWSVSAEVPQRMRNVHHYENEYEVVTYEGDDLPEHLERKGPYHRHDYASRSQW